MNDDGVITYLVHAKGPERYVFVFDEDSRCDFLRTLSRFAVNPELSFTWWDAAVLCKRARESAQEREIT